MEQVDKRFGDVYAVRGVNLRVAQGEFVTLLGPSGCGKTSTLRMVAGFSFPTSGEIYIGEERVTRIPPYRRSTGMVFQSYALFPHMTVEENVAFGLQIRKTPKPEISRRVTAALDLTRLRESASRFPATLSGGQQQRVALARSLVISPKVLLLDEPLGALDLKLREEMQLEIKRIQRELGITTLYVTHDQHEALSMSDRVAVINNGQILQFDIPERLYNYPTSEFVANFIGKMNFLPVEVAESVGGSNKLLVCLRDDPAKHFVAECNSELTFIRGDKCLLAFRPEEASLERRDLLNWIDGSVQKMTYYGNSSLCFVQFQDNELMIQVAARIPPKRPGDNVRVGWTHCVLVNDTVPGSRSASGAAAHARQRGAI
jgi:spermidine/putrescine ABC transporter ATP-binding subunit